MNDPHEGVMDMDGTLTRGAQGVGKGNDDSISSPTNIPSLC